MSKTITSGGVTFMDLTDSRKLDAYITSNLPTTQIYNQNSKTYTPDWSTTNLQLNVDIYLDSKEVTSNTYTSITWYKRIGTQSKTQIGTGANLTINSNQLIGNNSIITYICEAKYNDTATNPPTAHAEIVFTKVDTGLNGSNGQDGTGVTILGSYNTLSELQAAHPTGDAGNAYIVDGDLYVWAINDAQWENVGNIQGPAGADGRDAKSIVLSGDSQVFKVSKTNAITPSTIKVTAQAFNTTITNWTYSTNGGQTFLSTVPTGVLRSGNIVTVTGSTITSNSIVIKASDGEIDDVFTVYKAVDGSDGIQGNDGAPAPITFLTNENITFSANAQGQIATTTITSNVVAYNGTTKVTPTIGTITGVPTGMTITPSEITASNEVMLTITIANNSTLGSTSSNMGVISIPITYPVSTVLSLTWSKVNTGTTGATGAAGTDAYTVILTNESNTFAGDVSNAIAGSTTTQVLAYKGATAQTVTISSVNGKTASTADTDTGIAGLKFKCSALSGVSPTITFTCTTSFTSASGSIPIVLSVGGVSFTKMFTYSIAFKGATGTTGATGSAGVPATSYWLVSSASVVQKTSTGTITVTPSTLTFTGKNQTGTATPTDYACRWIIAYSTDGTNYTDLYTSTANETSKSITVATTYKTIRVRMYLAGGTTILLDEQIIPIVSDGAKGDTGANGTNASLVDITPSAYYFKSTTGKDGTFTPEYIYVYPRFQNVTFSKWEYSINGGTTWVAASGANGLTISTYNSVANTLRIAKTSTLYTDTVTSISFRCVSSNTSVYDTVSIAKIYDVVDLEIGGRNLLLNSGLPVTNSVYNIKKYDLAIKPTVGEQYTITLKGKLGDNKTSFSAYNSGGNVSLASLTRVGTSDIYQKTFNWKNNDRTDLDTSIFIYAMPNSVTTESTIEWIKLEKGNKATDWSPAPEDLNNITFQIYAPNGYLLTNELQSITLQTFAYEGSIEITSGAIFQWSHLIDNVWTDIDGATNTTLVVTKADVLKAKSYRCVMTYKTKTYTSTITVQDKTDTYNSVMCISSNATGSDCYWVLHTLVYSDSQEIDPLLGPVAINAPSSPISGDYWYAVDPTNATVQLKKYNGTSWDNSTDTQSLSYYWDIVDNGSTKIPLGDSAKVKVISCHDFTATATLICEVSNVEDGLLTQSSLSLTDASDPIVSTTEPMATADGQIWIKPNTNGTYLMFVWDEATQNWISSDMDTRSKVYTSRPSSYNAGDLWITASDIDHGSYLQGTLLQAQTYNNTYNAADWSPTLRYDHDLDDVKETLDNLSQYVTITPSGLRVAARDQNGNLSKFTSLFTSEALTFYEASQPLLVLANNQLTAPKIVVENELEIDGVIKLGNLNLTIESNGSFSFAVPK